MVSASLSARQVRSSKPPAASPCGNSPRSGTMSTRHPTVPANRESVRPWYGTHDDHLLATGHSMQRAQVRRRDGDEWREALSLRAFVESQGGLCFQLEVDDASRICGVRCFALERGGGLRNGRHR